MFGRDQDYRGYTPRESSLDTNNQRVTFERQSQSLTGQRQHTFSGSSSSSSGSSSNNVSRSLSFSSRRDNNASSSSIPCEYFNQLDVERIAAQQLLDAQVQKIADEKVHLLQQDLDRFADESIKALDARIEREALELKAIVQDFKVHSEQQLRLQGIHRTLEDQPWRDSEDNESWQEDNDDVDNVLATALKELNITRDHLRDEEVKSSTLLEERNDAQAALDNARQEVSQAHRTQQQQANELSRARAALQLEQKKVAEVTAEQQAALQLEQKKVAEVTAEQQAANVMANLHHEEKETLKKQLISYEERVKKDAEVQRMTEEKVQSAHAEHQRILNEEKQKVSTANTTLENLKREDKNEFEMIKAACRTAENKAIEIEAEKKAVKAQLTVSFETERSELKAKLGKLGEEMIKKELDIKVLVEQYQSECTKNDKICRTLGSQDVDGDFEIHIFNDKKMGPISISDAIEHGIDTNKIKRFNRQFDPAHATKVIQSLSLSHINPNATQLLTNSMNDRLTASEEAFDEVLFNTLRKSCRDTDDALVKLNMTRPTILSPISNLIAPSWTREMIARFSGFDSWESFVETIKELLKKAVCMNQSTFSLLNIEIDHVPSRKWLRAMLEQLEITNYLDAFKAIEGFLWKTLLFSTDNERKGSDLLVNIDTSVGVDGTITMESVSYLSAMSIFC